MSVIDELPFGPGYYHGPLRLDANTGFFSWNGSKVIPSAHKIHSGGYYYYFFFLDVFRFYFFRELSVSDRACAQHPNKHGQL